MAAALEMKMYLFNNVIEKQWDKCVNNDFVKYLIKMPIL